MNIKLELEQAFKDYSYYDPTHSYTHIPTGKNLTSVTQFLSSLKPAFNALFWSTLKAFEYSGYNILSKNEKENYFVIDDGEVITPIKGIETFYNLSKTPQDVEKDWKLLKDIGLSRGSYLHTLLENRELKIKDPEVWSFINDDIKNEITKQREINALPWDGEFSAIKESYSIIYELGLKYLNENKHLVPVAIETLVGDININLAGTFDRLYYNEVSKQFEIWDFKTDKKINYKNKYGKLKLFDMDDCEFNKYSLQTGLYKYIIETNTPIVLGDSYIVHFSHSDNKYDIIKADNHTQLIKEKLSNE